MIWLVLLSMCVGSAIFWAGHWMARPRPRPPVERVLPSALPARPRRKRTLKITLVGHDGRFTQWVEPGAQVYHPTAVWLVDVWYYGPLPREVAWLPMLQLPVTAKYVPAGCSLSVHLPSPICKTTDAMGHERYFYLGDP